MVLFTGFFSQIRSGDIKHWAELIFLSLNSDRTHRKIDQILVSDRLTVRQGDGRANGQTSTKRFLICCFLNQILLNPFLLLIVEVKDSSSTNLLLLKFFSLQVIDNKIKLQIIKEIKNNCIKTMNNYIKLLIIK